MSQHENALDSYHKALSLYEGLVHKGGMADQYYNMPI